MDSSETSEVQTASQEWTSEAMSHGTANCNINVNFWGYCLLEMQKERRIPPQLTSADFLMMFWGSVESSSALGRRLVGIEKVYG